MSEHRFWEQEPPPEPDELPPDPWSAPEDMPSGPAESRSAGPEDRPSPTSPVPPGDLPAAAQEILRDLTGDPDAGFHPGQFEAIQALVADHRRALVVQRTGWGKSAVYFIAALLQRRAGAGPALIVSPLLSLMRDQVAAAERAGVRAMAINSANVTEWSAIEAGLEADEIDVLLVSPERLVNPRFRSDQLPRLIATMGLLVIDEAHCISDWGHDFRPDYRRIRGLIERLPDSVPVLATTATANERVVEDVAEQLAAGGHDVFTLRGALARTSLRLGVLGLGSTAARLAWLREHLGGLPGSGIIYCLTVAAAEDTAASLRDAGHDVLPYTGRTEPAERLAAEESLKSNTVKALVATSALGMGFDKPDLGFVVHLGAPGSPVAYYQQVGRAGRATASADVLLLPGSEDPEIWHFFATNAMPTPRRATETIDALEAAGGPLSVAALESRVSLKRSQLDLLLKVLAVDGAVEYQQGGWVATGRPWHYDQERYDRIAAARAAEQRAMLDFEDLGPGSCRMEFLTSQLDDPHSVPCGRCDTCTKAWYPSEVSDAALTGARSSIQRVGVPIAPRALWPSGLDNLGVREAGEPLKGKIPESQRLERGRVVARLTDLGLGGELRALFTQDSEGNPVDRDLPPTLAKACLEVLAAWDWQQRPGAVAWIPSLGRPRLVEQLARGVAAAGRLTLLGSLGLTTQEVPSRSGSNSAFRIRDVIARFEVPGDMHPRLRDLQEPVLLIDDLVDSRWTMTAAGRLLLRAGAPAVLPFALASVG